MPKRSGDEELMAAYTAGDSAAFTELFDRYAPLLLGIMRRRLSSPDEAAELVQQTFLQLHRARGDFEQGRKLKPWLLTIAYNLLREHFRRKKRRPEGALSEEPVDPTERQDPVERAQMGASVRRALASLPDGQREVITMHWFEELSFPEVAEILGVSVSAVKVRAHRGYAALRIALEGVTKGDLERKEP